MTFRVVGSALIAAVTVALVLAAAPLAAMQSTPPGAQTQPLGMKGYPALGAPPIITVTRAGGAPTTQLRYNIPANQKVRIDTTVSMSIATTVSGTDKVASRDNKTMPTMRVTADLGVTSVATNGDITYDVAISGMTLDATNGADPKITQGMQPFVALMTSAKGSATISSGGVTRSTRLDVADSAKKTVLAHVVTAIEHLAIPFPDVAVGVGARWEVREALEVGGLTIFRPTVFQKTEYEVRSIDGPTVTLLVKTEQTTPAQLLSDTSLPVSNQGIAFGAENRLQRMSGSGTGTVVVRLDSLAPVSEHQSTASMAMTMSMNGQAGSLTVDGKVKITIAPPGMAGAPDKFFDVKALRGINTVNLGGTPDSTVGPERVCYPRAAGDPRAGVRIAMGGLLAATMDVLKAGRIETTPRSTDFLRIDAQIRDAEQCSATITLKLSRGLGSERRRYNQNGELIVGSETSPAVWRRTFEVTGAPEGFSSRVIDRLKLAVRDFVSDVAQANLRK